jgi:gamma-glutamyl hercynylcysteine S-oxide synthase
MTQHPVTADEGQPGEQDGAALRDRAVAELAAARMRTELLTTAVDDGDLVKQHSPLMSPLVWDLAHIANQEELWLLRAVGGADAMHPGIDALYDAFQHPRAERPALPLLGPAEARAYGHEVRGRVLDLAGRLSFDRTASAGPAGRSRPGAARPGLGSGFGAELSGAGARFAFGMVAQHEAQHDETMLATHQLRTGPGALTAPPPPAPADAAALPAEVFVPGGPFTMGTSAEPWALDNERPAHLVDVPGFWLDTTPVTNAAYAQFIADGGYDDPRLWTADGWAHRQRAGLTAPLFWSWEGSWVRLSFGVREPVLADEPVLHVCWYEADAYARWAGRRLPTEAEWEKAARWDPAASRSRRYPWGDAEWTPGRANLGQRHLRPAPAGSYPDGAAPCGARQLLGDVWEWTSSDFGPYPGFTAWPYREYSEVFFGPEYKVLRGGSFGVSAVACRGTFRNWDYPIRRQIFAGFRTARSDFRGADSGRAAPSPERP